MDRKLNCSQTHTQKKYALGICLVWLFIYSKNDALSQDLAQQQVQAELCSYKIHINIKSAGCVDIKCFRVLCSLYKKIDIQLIFSSKRINLHPDLIKIKIYCVLFSAFVSFLCKKKTVPRSRNHQKIGVKFLKRF